MSTEVKMDVIPDCDLCAHEKSKGERDVVNVAQYDAATTFGSWAYMCQHHMSLYGLGLGTGRGQKLVKR